MCEEKIENTLDTLCQYIYEKNKCLQAGERLLLEKEKEIASLKAQLEIQMSTLNSKLSELEEKDKKIKWYSEQVDKQLEQIHLLITENSKYKDLKKANEEVKKVMEEIASEKHKERK